MVELAALLHQGEARHCQVSGEPGEHSPEMLLPVADRHLQHQGSPPHGGGSEIAGSVRCAPGLEGRREDPAVRATLHGPCGYLLQAENPDQVATSIQEHT